MATTYRLRPDIARTVNTVFRPVFADEARGGGGRLDIDFEPLESAREPRLDPSVHIARYNGRHEPGDDGIEQRAESVSTYLAAALADGALGENPSVTVLFWNRYPMATYADAFEAKGLSVGYGGNELFASPHVQFASAAVQWLQDPYSRDETERLVANGIVPRLDRSIESTGPIIDYLCAAVSDGDADLPDDAVNLTDGEARLLEGLTDLADRHRSHLASSAADVVEDVVDTLALPAAPIETDTSPTQRVANMDALVETISNFENDDRIPLAELAEVMAELCDDEGRGPSQPMVDEESFDVVLKTVHRMKGDQDDVVVVAELGNRVGRRGPWGEPFLDRGDTVALSPPRNYETPSIPGLDQGVFSRDYGDRQLPTGEYRTRRDAGLRWAHDRTRESSRDLAGSPALASVAADHRAEEWRTLFVAMTRAMEHLVIPLPESSTARPQDRWLATLYEALEFDGAHTDSRHQITVLDADGTDTTLTLGVNEPDIMNTPQTTSTVGRPHAATLPEDWKTGWTPKHVNGSSLFPLVSSPEANFVPHIQSTALGDGHRDTVTDTDAPLDVVNPDTLGKITHDAIGAVVTGAVNATDIRTMSTTARQAFERLVDKRAGHLSDGGRERVLDYLHEVVCSQFLVTDTWERLHECPHVYREEPIHAVLETGTRGRAVESQNQADFISKDPSGAWYIDEIKFTFRSLDERTHRRHQLQTTFYEWLLEMEVDSTEIHSRITYLGVQESVEDAESPIGSIEMWVDRLDNLFE